VKKQGVPRDVWCQESGVSYGGASYVCNRLNVGINDSVHVVSGFKGDGVKGGIAWKRVGSNFSLSTSSAHTF
jgi:hypothetical protein